jgi:hypothetical protein
MEEPTANTETQPVSDKTGRKMFANDALKFGLVLIAISGGSFLAIPAAGSQGSFSAGLLRLLGLDFFGGLVYFILAFVAGISGVVLIIKGFSSK